MKCEELFQTCKARGVSDAFILDRSGKEICLYMPLPPAEMTLIDQKLDEVLSVWIQLWRQHLGPSAEHAEESKRSDVVP
jgi:hypothetical protein